MIRTKLISLISSIIVFVGIVIIIVGLLIGLKRISPESFEKASIEKVAFAVDGKCYAQLWQGTMYLGFVKAECTE